MKLKEVLHFYIGCECYFYFDEEKNEFDCTGKIISVDSKWERGLRNPYPIRSYTKRGKQDEGYWCESFFHWDFCKPILRPMSDLTKEELRSQGFDTHIDYLTHEAGNPLQAPFDMVLYCIKQGFDVFGLIASGQASNKAHTGKVK